jgi:hypothetical protein
MRAPTLAALAVLVLLAAGGMHAFAATPEAPCSNRITGTVYSDTLSGTTAGDRISGLAGDDALRGREGDDCLFGGSGNDAQWGGAGADRVSGGAGDDRLVGEDGADELVGGAGADVIDEVEYGYPAGWRPGAGGNVIQGGPGADVIDAANGRRDRISCGGGRDTVSADRADTLAGCEKRRRLVSPLPSASPRAAGRRRAVTISFRALDDLRAPGEFISIVVDGPPGCGRSVGNSVGVSYSRNKVVRYRLKPFKGAARRAHRWCRGRYTGSASVMRTVQASCTIRPSRLPAQSCVAETKLGGFSFRVRH